MRISSAPDLKEEKPALNRRYIRRGLKYKISFTSNPIFTPTHGSEVNLSVSIHGHALRTSAQLPVCGRTNGPATSHTACCTTFLQSQQLLRSERLIVNLARRFDEILEVSTCKEVPEINEFAMVLVLDIDDTPFVLSASDLLAINNDGFLAADDGEWDDVLDGRIGCSLLIIQLFVVIGIHFQVVKSELLLDAFFECSALLQRKGVGLCDDRHDIDNIGELLQNHNVNRFEGVARRLDEEQAAVNSCVLDVSLSLRSELLSEVSTMLVFDVFHNGIPASIVVDQISIARSVNNVQAQADSILFDNCGIRQFCDALVATEFN